MLLSFALIFLIGIGFGNIFAKVGLPKLFGMLLKGVLLGPYVFDLLGSSILNISSDLRQIALIIILIRAGLNLDINDLKKAGRPAILMCFVPACFEMIGILILAPKLLGISFLDAAIMGTVVSAVSPAVVIPRMLKLIDEGYGNNRRIPQIIMAGASVDDIFVIVLFSVFTGLARNGVISKMHFLKIPSSIIFGLLGGIIVGIILTFIFRKFNISNISKIIIVLSVSFLLVCVEHIISDIVGFSGLLAVMSLGGTIHQTEFEISKQLSSKFVELWMIAKVLLFVLVGATINIGYALNSGFSAVLLVFGALLFRSIGVFVSLIRTDFNWMERIFTVFAYMPKATVQAAIGGAPLAMGLACGEIVLTVAVISIIITAPLGAILIDATYKRYLPKDVK